ncbi:MAG: LapA family protein, partial [Nitrospinaceae bacterium]|nr:LapA family protein [Nitrospinaceae bacterium]
MGALRLIFGLFIAVLIVSFGVLNMELISVKYHRIGTLQLPIFYFLVIFFSAGFLVAWVGGLLDRIRFFTRIRGYRKEVKNLRRELEVAQNKNGRLLATS